MNALLVAFLLFVLCFDLAIFLTSFKISGRESRKEEKEEKEIIETLEKNRNGDA